jgi:N-acetylneuraminic acid mutarotase
VFGGSRDDVVNGDVTIYDDLHRFDTAARRWTVLTPNSASPPPRVFAASVAHRPSRRMLVFGGAFFGPFFSDFSAYGDLWAYDVDDNAWTELHPANAGPSPRSRPTAWMVDNQMFVFGGVTSFFQVLDDLWVYDLRTNAWTELIPLGAAGSPPPRHEAAADTEAHRGRLVLYGGEAIDEAFQFTVLGDTWEYSLSSGRWRDVTPPPPDNVAPPRNYGTAALIGDSMYLQGGDTPGGDDCGAVFPQNPNRELWRFDLRDRVWEQQFPDGSPLVRLKRTNSARVGDAMYVFAGFDFVCEDPVTPRQIWNLDVYRFEP